ncbi:MAG TPA: transferase hexapeptide repeat family protein [Saprospiraceae bacterium]|nr:transferase hexapeptide repeat family protein [Saprospiraceae bacterium]
MIYQFESFIPVIDETAYIHPQAVIIGHVVIGKDVYVGAGAVIRGDWGGIYIKDGANVQENCIIHMFPGLNITLEEGAHIGHGAIIHGANIGRNCLVGMNAVVMDQSEIGAGSIIGALTFVKANTIIPERSLVLGNPGKIIKKVSDEMLAWKTKGTAIYQALPKTCLESLEPCEPLRKPPKNRQVQSRIYETWKDTKK